MYIIPEKEPYFISVPVSDDNVEDKTKLILTEDLEEVSGPCYVSENDLDLIKEAVRYIVKSCVKSEKIHMGTLSQESLSFAALIQING